MHPQRKSVAPLVRHIFRWHHYRVYPYSHARASGSLTRCKKTHLFPNHFKHSLISVAHLCDHGCEAIFSAPRVTASKGGLSLFVGWRAYSTILWRIDLSVNNLYKQRPIEDTIAYLHAACFIPVKDTWISAIEAGNFPGWSALSPDRVRKYLHKSDDNVKGHMNQQRQNTCSTQQRPPYDAPDLAPEDIDKTNFVSAKIVDAGLIHSYLTGLFPTTSTKDNNYVLVLYDYNTKKYSQSQ
jgi:hypothetical protein